MSEIAFDLFTKTDNPTPTTHEQFLINMYKRALQHETNIIKKQSELESNDKYRKKRHGTITEQNRSNTQHGDN